jgi:hypothetical protein
MNLVLRHLATSSTPRKLVRKWGEQHGRVGVDFVFPGRSAGYPVLLPGKINEYHNLLI